MNLTSITSFDKTEQTPGLFQQPEKYSEVLKKFNGPVIARGAGLSYCNATAVRDGISLDMRLFNRLIGFDEVNGVVTVEAGMAVGELNNFVIQRGWVMPVLPGYPLITVGGCIAFNIHGKSQFSVGLFQDWIEELVLFHPLHGEMTCSRTTNPDTFDLTIGGMGFTGIILNATLRLKKIHGDILQVKKIFVKTLDEAVGIMKENAGLYDYIYSWHDFNRRGKSFGKGLVYLEKTEDGTWKKNKPVVFRNRLLPPSKIPRMLNRFTIGWMCRIYYQMERLKSSHRRVTLDRASFPIYGKEIYYHLFGKKGFREYQVLFPHADWKTAVDEIQQLVRNTKTGIALASLKIFKGKTHNLSFSGEGICLAMDIPNTLKSISFFEQLDLITIKNRGIINLSKDSRAGSELVKKTYPAYQRFTERINQFDPQRIFLSDLRSRLEI